MPIVYTLREGYGFRSYFTVPFTGIPLVFIGASGKAVAYGVIAIGPITLGILALGWISFGGALAVGQVAVAPGVALGQVAIAAVVGIGQLSTGIWALGMFSFGIFYRCLLGIGVFGGSELFYKPGADQFFDDLFERFYLQPNCFATLVFYVVLVCIVLFFTVIGEIVYFTRNRTFVQVGNSRSNGKSPFSWKIRQKGEVLDQNHTVNHESITNSRDLDIKEPGTSSAVFGEGRTGSRSKEGEFYGNNEKATGMKAEGGKSKASKKGKSNLEGKPRKGNSAGGVGTYAELGDGDEREYSPYSENPVHEGTADEVYDIYRYGPNDHWEPPPPDYQSIARNFDEQTGGVDTDYDYRPFDAHDDGDRCAVCLARSREMVFLPCGHVCACRNCSEELLRLKKPCPLCRNAIVRIQKIFYS